MLMNPLSALSPQPVQITAGVDRASTIASQALQDGAYMALDQFGLIEVEGADAAVFLHNLLTNDLQTLMIDEARLAGFCTPKGRLLASFLVWHDPKTLRLMVSADILAPIQKRLSMFVLRSKAKLTDVSAQTRLIGLTGQGADALLPIFGALPSEPYSAIHGGPDAELGTLVRLPDAAGVTRHLWAAPVAVFEQHVSLLQPLTRTSAHVWDWLAIQAGEPRISAATQEKFVPQMINFEAIGGVNFKKGCYPGQEIVARSQYLGTVKRRAMIAHAAAVDTTLAAGTDVFHSADPGQPCGMVINMAPAPDGGHDYLIELKLDALSHGTVHLAAADGPLLAFSALPYVLPDKNA